MMTLAAFLVAAALAYMLADRLRLPVLPWLIIAGLGLGFLPVSPSPEMARTVLELGLAVLVFCAGIELSPRRFAHQTSAVVWVAVVQFLFVGCIGMLCARALGHGDVASIYIGFALSASSTLVVIRHLRRQQQMFQPFGRLVTGVLLVQDVMLIVLLTMLSTEVVVPWHTGKALGGFALLAGTALLFHYRVLPYLVRRLLSDDEILLLLALAVLCLFAAGAWFLGVPLVAGAFLAGFTLSAFPVNGLVRGLVGSLGDFFQALFFVALGTLLLPADWLVVGQAVLLAALVFLVTPPIVALVAEWRGQTSRSGVESGLLLAQTSELGIIFALLGMQNGHLGQNEFTLIALVAAITMTITPLVATDKVTWKLLHWHPSRRRKLPALKHEGHVLILGFGSAGMWAARPIQEAGYDLLVVDDDPTVVEMLVAKNIACVRGDGSDPRILEQVKARQAHLILASIPRLPDLLQVIRQTDGVPVVARVFEDFEAELIEQAGGVAIKNSEAAAGEFAKWFANFHQKHKDGAAEA
jgi:Kef-type K+ transport system membrane component KefB